MMTVEEAKARLDRATLAFGMAGRGLTFHERHGHDTVSREETMRRIRHYNEAQHEWEWAKRDLIRAQVHAKFNKEKS